MVMYANKFETKEKLKLAEIKTELTASTYTYVFGGGNLSFRTYLYVLGIHAASHDWDGNENGKKAIG